MNPINAGTQQKRITYRSVVPGKAVITGADAFDNWEPYQKDVWKLTVPNTYFGNYNPYTTQVTGDWLDITVPVHTGEVYLNGKFLYEKDSLEKVLEPEYYDASWDRDFTKHTWYTCQSDTEDATIIYANFQGKNPNQENVEIHVRPHCFWPQQMHVDYITLSGFIVTKAATQWAPPTALQDGMIGPHWSKGWIIENCEISHSKCCGISLGKYRQQHNDNKWLHYKYKDGAQTQRDCTRGIWLDWQCQGTRVSCNLFHDNCMSRFSRAERPLLYAASCMDGNAYFNGARPCVLEEKPMVDMEHKIRIELKEENGTYRIVSDYKDYLPEVQMISSDTLGVAFEPEQRFETPDGEDIIFDTDYYGKQRGRSLTAGPFAE